MEELKGSLEGLEFLIEKSRPVPQTIELGTNEDMFLSFVSSATFRCVPSSWKEHSFEVAGPLCARSV